MLGPDEGLDIGDGGGRSGEGVDGPDEGFLERGRSVVGGCLISSKGSVEATSLSSISAFARGSRVAFWGPADALGSLRTLLLKLSKPSRVISLGG